jgi:hypothetical protein
MTALTDHFTLDELTRSDTAVRLGIDNSAPDLLWMPLAAIVAAGWRQVPALAMAYANRKIGGGTTGS